MSNLVPLTPEEETALVAKGKRRIERIVVQRLLFEKPFWAAICFRLKRTVKMHEGTAWTDGRQIMFDAEFIDELNSNQLLGLILHELAHVVFCHHLRKGSRDHQLWNAATDYCINWMLVEDDDNEMPDGVLLDSEYAKDWAESAYDKLFKKFPPPPPCGGIGSPDGPCNGGQGGQGQQPPPGQGQPGQGGAGGPAPDQGWGEVRDMLTEEGKPLTNTQAKEEEEAMQVAVRQTMNDKRVQGSMPGHLRERFEKMLETQLDWRGIIAEFLGERFPMDYSWNVPNTRRQMPETIYPGRDGVLYKRVGLAIDSSGSVSEKEMQQMVSEVQHCMTAYDDNGQDMSIYVMYCDTRVHGKEELESGDLPFQDIEGGGGGTDFAPVMEEIPELEEEIACLIYMTDGHCDSFGNQPDCEVLWVLVGDYINETFKPPFGQVARMSLN